MCLESYMMFGISAVFLIIAMPTLVRFFAYKSVHATCLDTEYGASHVGIFSSADGYRSKFEFYLNDVLYETWEVGYFNKRPLRAGKKYQIYVNPNDTNYILGPSKIKLAYKCLFGAICTAVIAVWMLLP